MARNWIHVEFDAVKKVTEKAILFVIDGEEVWLPISQISPEDVDSYAEGDGEGSVSITDWIAHEKGLA